VTITWHTASPWAYNIAMGTEVIAKLTFEQFRELPSDGKRYELVHGEVHFIPTPNTRHQFTLQNLALSLGPYARMNHLGEYLVAPLDVRLGEKTVLQPDLIYISNARAGIIQENWIEGAPDLAVEVLSPSTAGHDRATKLPIYASVGVPEVWFIDPKAKTVEVLTLQGAKYLVEATYAGHHVLTSNLFPGWKLPLAELFDFRGRF
jgi:Uma2 family endonuclease